MISRLIQDIYHLKRIHVNVPDRVLGDILTDKLCRLNLKPALMELELRAGCRIAPAGHRVLFSATAAVAGVESTHPRITATPDSAAMCHLLDCLAYFQLGKQQVTTDALQLVKVSLPHMSGEQLARTLAACCALGQHDASVPTLPLLTYALHGMRPIDGRSAASCAYGSRSLGGTPIDDEGTLFHDSGDVIKLMEAMRHVGVSQEDVWSLLAEHCARRLSNFDGKQLLRAIEIFYLQRVSYYPDFFLAAERHIAAQPSSYMTPEQLQQVMEYYKGLGQSVVSLLSISAGRFSDSFDSGLAAAATKMSIPLATSAVTSTHTKTGYRAPVEEPAAIAAFVQIAIKTVDVADGQQLLDLLHKCESKRVMHRKIMEAVTGRILFLYFPSMLKTGTDVGASDRGDARGSQHLSPTDVHHVIHVIKVMLQFNDAEYFVSAAVPLCQILDSIVDVALPLSHHRLLVIASGTCKVFPAGTQPSHFYRSLVTYLGLTRETATSESQQRMQLLATVLISLKAYGGYELLTQYMPAITMTMTNAPRRVQIDLAARLSILPAAKEEFLPFVFRSMTLQKNWQRSLMVAEVPQLLDAMSHSGLKDSRIMMGVVDFIRVHRNRFDSADLVNHLYTLVRLGFHDIDFYSSTAEYLLDMTSSTRNPTTVHDICLLLYVFTFVLKGVIRVVQQILPRLRVSAGHANARDITLALYSLVKLQATRHRDITGPLCDRAATILPLFKAQELASMWSSLRALGYSHTALLSMTVRVIIDDTQRRARLPLPSRGRGDPSVDPCDGGGSASVLSDDEFISIVSAVVQLSEKDPLLVRGDSAPGHHAKVSKVENGADAEGCSPNFLYDDSRVTEEYKHISIRRTALPLNGLQLYLVITTLAKLPGIVLSTAEWSLLAVKADEQCRQLSSGTSEVMKAGCAAAEVIVALEQMYRRACPTLPDEETKMQYWVTATKQWETHLPPRLIAHVVEHMKHVMSQPAIKDGLKRTGLLQILSGLGTAGGATIKGGNEKKMDSVPVIETAMAEMDAKGILPTVRRSVLSEVPIPSPPAIPRRKRVDSVSRSSKQASSSPGRRR